MERRRAARVHGPRVGPWREEEGNGLQSRREEEGRGAGQLGPRPRGAELGHKL